MERGVFGCTIYLFRHDKSVTKRRLFFVEFPTVLFLVMRNAGGGAVQLVTPSTFAITRLSIISFMIGVWLPQYFVWFLVVC